MPSRFRELTPDGGVLAQGIDECLDFYPPDQWDARAGRVAGTDDFTAAGRMPAENCLPVLKIADLISKVALLFQLAFGLPLV